MNRRTFLAWVAALPIALAGYNSSQTPNPQPSSTSITVEYKPSLEDNLDAFLTRQKLNLSLKW